VCPSIPPYTVLPYIYERCSSGCSGRRAPSRLGRGSTSITRRPGSIPAPPATRRFTRAAPSLTAAAAGLPSSMVKIPLFSRYLARRRFHLLNSFVVQPSQAPYPATRTAPLAGSAPRSPVRLVEVTSDMCSKGRVTKLQVRGHFACFLLWPSEKHTDLDYLCSR
jgi:hypothetical protein